MTFNYFLICSTNSCKVGKKFKIILDSYVNHGNCLLKKEVKNNLPFYVKTAVKFIYQF